MEQVIPSYDSFREWYPTLVSHVKTAGDPVPVSGRLTYEVRNTTFVTSNVYAPTLPIGMKRGINTQFAAVEALQLIAGVCDPDSLRLAAPRFTSVMTSQSDTNVIYGAYGPRAANQLRDVVSLLRRKPETRQAVVSIWQPKDLQYTKDLPCTTTLQFILRDVDQLELHVTMRSNDVWLGLPYDTFVFTQLQHTVANALGVNCGDYVHRVTSLHLYHRDTDDVDAMLRHLGHNEMTPDHVLPVPRGVTVYDPELYPNDDVWGRFQHEARSILAYNRSVTTTLNPWYVSRINAMWTEDDRHDTTE